MQFLTVTTGEDKLSVAVAAIENYFPKLDGKVVIRHECSNGKFVEDEIRESLDQINAQIKKSEIADRFLTLTHSDKSRRLNITINFGRVLACRQNGNHPTAIEQRSGTTHAIESHDTIMDRLGPQCILSATPQPKAIPGPQPT